VVRWALMSATKTSSVGFEVEVGVMGPPERVETPGRTESNLALTNLRSWSRAKRGMKGAR
jgi:hypothetical protein